MAAPVVGRPLTQVAIAEAKRNWPFVVGFAVTFSLIFKLSASLDQSQAHKSKFVDPYGHHWHWFPGCKFRHFGLANRKCKTDEKVTMFGNIGEPVLGLGSDQRFSSNERSLVRWLSAMPLYFKVMRGKLLISAPLVYKRSQVVNIDSRFWKILLESGHTANDTTSDTLGAELIEAMCTGAAHPGATVSFFPVPAQHRLVSRDTLPQKLAFVFHVVKRKEAQINLYGCELPPKYDFLFQAMGAGASGAL